MRFHLITLFPEACEAYLSASIIGRARKEKQIRVEYQNPRDFVETKGSKARKGAWRPRANVDARPYGGGPGMVMSALPVVKATQKALSQNVRHRKSYIKKTVIVWFAPGAKAFTNKEADKLGKSDEVVLICGRYEGIDERAKKMLKTLAAASPGRTVGVQEYSVGEAVYTGGEVPALAVVDAVTRRLPGVLGKDESVEERRVASHAVYTRPETIEYKGKKYRVPKVLQTGHHAKIDEWRAKRRAK